LRPEFVEVLVKLPKVRAGQVPVQVLAQQRELDQVDQLALEQGPEPGALLVTERRMAVGDDQGSRSCGRPFGGPVGMS
jgi:hypothetical protein